MQYRARLSAIVRHAAAVLPEQALAAAQRRLDAAVAACSPGSGVRLAGTVFLVCSRHTGWEWSFWCVVCAQGANSSNHTFTLSTSCPFALPSLAGTKVEDARGLLESAVHFSESTFKAVWDGSIQEQPGKLQGEECSVQSTASCTASCTEAVLRAALSAHGSVRGDEMQCCQ